MTRHEFDLVVLGGGSGGYAAALRGAELGMRVALIEKDKVGGTCLHRGCVPTKALLHSAEVADLTREAAAVGIDATFAGVDVAGMAAYRDGIVSKKYAGLSGLVSGRGITVVHGDGVLSPDRTVIVGEDEYAGSDLVLATGAVPRGIPGLVEDPRVVTSDGALTLDRVPDHALILGGGVIGVEFASIWRSLGAEVTIVEALPRLIPADDETMSSHLQRAFRKRGITVRTGVRVTGATADADGIAVSLDDGSDSRADVVLVAVGRAPATAGLGLAEAGVELEDGFVRVEESLRTTAAHVWAVGDIVRGPQVAHRGFQQGIFVAETIAGGSPTPIPDVQIPRVAYSHPEVASVGLSQAAAEAEHGADRVVTFEYNLAGNARSAILGTAGVAKVVRVVDGPVVGVHLIGDRVGELITEAQLVIGWEAHPEDVAPFVHAHPTQSEALGEAFLALAGKPLHTL